MLIRSSVASFFETVGKLAQKSQFGQLWKKKRPLHIPYQKSSHCGRTSGFGLKVIFDAAVCLQFSIEIQLFIYIFNCLLTFLAVCLHFQFKLQLFIYCFSSKFSCLFTFSVQIQLFIYIFSCLFTYHMFVYIISYLFTFSAVCLHFQLFDYILTVCL